MEDEIESVREQVDVPPECLAHTTLDPVAIMGLAENFTYRQAYARTWGRQGLWGEEPAHQGGLPFARCRIGTLVVRMFA